MSGQTNREKELFAQALGLQPDERGAFLKRACGTDAELLRQVQDLLDAHTDDSPVLRTTSTAVLGGETLSEGPGTKIGRYKLLQKIGEGGMGVVYMAEQTEPVHRRVALKIIKLGMDTRQVVARFEAERQALALMDHPNIARVLDGGATETGRPYFVMELVQGVPITEFCDRNKLAAQERLGLFVLVCQAIQSAHQKGIIHRDIKPSNVLVTLHHGEPMPKVIDFGIAKATNQKLTEKTLFTQYAAMIGTPAYMSPEQAEMSSMDVDTRTDIYALGVLLYELLTGTTPFPERRLRSLGYGEMQRVIMEEEPERPSTRLSTMANEQKTALARSHGQHLDALDTLLRGDLDWIVMKCLEKDRTRRYETANGLAADLKRHLNNEPVIARPPTAVYKLQKAWKRNKVTYTAGAAVAVALVIGIGASLWQMSRARQAEREESRHREIAVNALAGEEKQRTRAEAERRRAENQELEARHRAYASDMNIAKQALDENNLGRALEMLNQQRPAPGQTDLRGWEWRYLWSQTRSDALFTLCQETSEIHSLAVSSDGNLVAATVYGQGGLSLWSVPDRVPVLRLAETEQNVCAVISPTEPLLAFTSFTLDASGKQRSSLRLWNISSRKTITEWPLDGECASLAISGDGRTLATITTGEKMSYKSEGHITWWGLPEGTELWSYPIPGTDSGLAVTPDLGLVAISANGIRVIDARDRRELWSEEGSAKSLALSPDGTLLAIGDDGQEILLWDAATGQERGRLAGHQSWVNSLVFWPDGKKLASGSADQTIRIWDISSGECVDVLSGHRQQVRQLALMPDQKTLVSGSRDGAVCLWDTSVDNPRRPRIEIPDHALTWAFEAGSKSVLTLNEKGRVTRWKGKNFQVPELLVDTGDLAIDYGFAWCFSSDGRRLALGSIEGVVQVWDIPNQALLWQFTNSTELVRAVRFFDDGNRLLTLSVKDFVVHVFDLTTGLEVQSWRAPADRIHFALSPDERHCVTMGYAGDVLITDLINKTTGELHFDVRQSHDGNYSPDQRLLAVPSSLGFVRIWDVGTWSEVMELHGFFDEVFGAVFLSDGTRLIVAAGGHEAIRLYDTANWQDTLTLEAEYRLWPTMISPDDNVIGATPIGGGRLQLWHAPSMAEITAVEARDVAKPRE